VRLLVTQLNRLAAWWFLPRRFELEGALYRRVGVRFFQRIIAGIGRFLPFLQYGLAGQETAHLQRFESRTRLNETIHLLIGVCMFAALFIVLARHRLPPLDLILFGCVLNTYLILLQRYNRVRLLQAIGRRSRRK
jgi:hypothetical protein